MDISKRILMGETEIKKEYPCHPCGIAAVEIAVNAHGAIEALEALRKMDSMGTTETTIQKLTFTKSELESKVRKHKCLIEKKLDAYEECCKTGHLPHVGTFEC